VLARSPRQQLVIAIVAAVALVGGVSYELLRGGGSEDSHRLPSITEHTGTLHWTPRGPNPEPRLSEHYWTWAYPAAYASRVRPGIGVYWRSRRIGFVGTERVDDGTVWVYAWIAPEYQTIAAQSVESEPIETPEGPRIVIYRISNAPPATATEA